MDRSPPDSARRCLGQDGEAPQRLADDLALPLEPMLIGLGRITMINWTLEGLVGELFRTMGPYAAPPPGANHRRCGAPRTTSASCSGRGAGH